MIICTLKGLVKSSNNREVLVSDNLQVPDDRKGENQVTVCSDCFEAEMGDILLLTIWKTLPSPKKVSWMQSEANPQYGPSHPPPAALQPLPRVLPRRPDPEDGHESRWSSLHIASTWGQASEKAPEAGCAFEVIIFWGPSLWDDFSWVSESNFSAKMGKNFHVCLQSGPSPDNTKSGRALTKEMCENVSWY